MQKPEVSESRDVTQEANESIPTTVRDSDARVRVASVVPAPGGDDIAATSTADGTHVLLLPSFGITVAGPLLPALRPRDRIRLARLLLPRSLALEVLTTPPVLTA